MPAEELKRQDVHDLYIYLERWRNLNDRDTRAEVRWLSEQVRLLSETAFNIKRGDLPHAQQEAIRDFRRQELQAEICKLEKQVGQHHQELESLSA